MAVTNRDIKPKARQVFASTRAIVTPFYNRVSSKQELTGMFTNLDAMRGSAIFVSAPMGTGKTFFIENVTPQLGIAARERPLLAPEVSDRDLNRTKGDVVFVDESDIKASWERLSRGLAAVGRHLVESGRVGLVLGDLVLRNRELRALFPNHCFLRNFEYLDREFLHGVIRQRLEHYGLGRGQDVIDPDLYDILAPAETASVNSFRTILSFLHGLVDTLPQNNASCWLTVDMATRHAKAAFDAEFSDDRQEKFLNIFLDYLSENHPRGTGLGSGLTKEQIFLLGRRADYTDWESFQEDIIEPFGRDGLLLSSGIPRLDENGHFARWVEPYYPSLLLRLLAEASAD